MTIKEAESFLKRIDTIKREESKLSEEKKELEDRIKEFMGQEEHKRVGAFDVYYKYIDVVGKINEDKLRADYPLTYKKCISEKVDVRMLCKIDPSAYNDVLVSGDPVRRFSYKVDIEKLVEKTEKRVKKELKSEAN